MMEKPITQKDWVTVLAYSFGLTVILTSVAVLVLTVGTVIQKILF